MGEININTPYDDVFRTLVERSTHLLIPLINERFHTKYGMDALAEPLANEHFYTERDAKQVKRVTDSSIRIMNHLYHLECQTTPDGDIVIRMVEYDFHIGLGNISTNNGRRELKFPQ